MGERKVGTGRAFLLAAGAAVGLAAGLALAARAPVAAAAAPQFEHKVVAVDFDDYKDTEVYRNVERETKSPYAAALRMQELALEKLGAEGWELVAVDQRVPAKAVFYLKRAGR
jgi:spermidine/putrescine-binding protein